MTAAQAKKQAKTLLAQERNTGPAWGPIIKALGYDPRQGSGKSTTYGGNPAGGQRPKPEPTPQDKPEPTPQVPAKPTAAYDSRYTADTAQNKYQQETGNIALDTQADRMGFDTGYGAGGQVDTRNAYSQAMELQRSWEQGQRGISTSMASRGQLYSSARQHSLDDATHNYNRSSSALQTGAQRGYEDITTQRQALEHQRTTGDTYALFDQQDRSAAALKDWYELYG